MSVKNAAKFLQFLVKAFEANVVEKNETPSGTVGHARCLSVIQFWNAARCTGMGPRTATMHLYVPDVDAVYDTH